MYIGSECKRGGRTLAFTWSNVNEFVIERDSWAIFTDKFGTAVMIILAGDVGGNWTTY